MTAFRMLSQESPQYYSNAKPAVNPWNDLADDPHLVAHRPESDGMKNDALESVDVVE